MSFFYRPHKKLFRFVNFLSRFFDRDRQIKSFRPPSRRSNQNSNLPLFIFVEPRAAECYAQTATRCVVVAIADDEDDERRLSRSLGSRAHRRSLSLARVS